MKFVAADPLTGDISVAAQIAAQTLGPEFKQWLNDPQKLLQLIAAAEGANAAGGGTRQGGGVRGSLRKRAEQFQDQRSNGGAGPGCRKWREQARLPHGMAEWFRLQEAEVVQAIRLLTRFGQVQRDPNVRPEDMQKEVGETDPNTRLNLQQLLGSSGGQGDQPSRKIRRCS